MPRPVTWSLTVTVALVLADSAIVTLALPDILRHLDASVTEVAWVLIAYNLVLGLVAVPVALLVRRTSARAVAAGGIAVFACSSAACGLAGSIEFLIAARCVQAVGGALALAGILELLVAARGRQRGVATWVTAGVVGTAVGPAAGGVLTETIAWQAIFWVQVPFAVLAVPAALAVRVLVAAEPGRDRPAVRTNLTVGLLSAALTAALFLVVLLLVEGWHRSPAAAALAVTAVPLGALAAGPLARLLRPSPAVEVATGCLLVAGGLVALALPPSAALGWTLAPQALVGLGLGLTIDRLSWRAVAERSPRAVHAGWNVASRHLGVVLGLALLTPVFTADLADAEDPAQQAVAAVVLDAPLTLRAKVAVAESLGDVLAGQRGQVPDVRGAVRLADVDRREAGALGRVEDELVGQLERAATRAFRDSFLVGAALALAAALTVVPLRRRERA